MPVQDRPALGPGVLTLPARYYTDPALFERELAAIYGGMWLHAGRTEEIPEPGSFVVRRVGRASVIIARREDGAVAAYHNVCRHRGTMLCKGDEGRFRGRIQCAYHAWTYGLDGQLLAAPHMDKVEGFREEDHSLFAVAAAVWDGHVFIHLGPRPGSLADQLAGLDAKFRPWRMEELTRVERRVYPVRANWKLIVQNYSECLHCPVAHPLLQRHSHYLSGDNEPPQSTYLGGRMDLREGVASLTLDGTSPWAPLRGLAPDERRRVYYYALLPNLLLNLHPDYMLTFTLWPRAVDLTEIVCEWHVHRDEARRPGFDPSGAVGFWERTNREDWELSELAQQGIGSPAYRPGPYSNREELLHAFDGWVLERLKEERDT